MIDLMDRHSSWGKPFQTLWITTKKYGSVAVHANGTTRTSPGHPSQLSEQIDYPGPPIPIIRLEQGQSGTTRPKRQLYTQCTVGQKANAEHQDMSGDMITFWCFTDMAVCSSQYVIKARQEEICTDCKFTGLSKSLWHSVGSKQLWPNSNLAN